MALWFQRLDSRPYWAGASAYSRLYDYGRMREIADQSNAYLLADMAGREETRSHPPRDVPVPHYLTALTIAASIHFPQSSVRGSQSRPPGHERPAFHNQPRHRFQMRLLATESPVTLVIILLFRSSIARRLLLVVTFVFRALLSPPPTRCLLDQCANEPRVRVLRHAVEIRRLRWRNLRVLRRRKE